MLFSDRLKGMLFVAILGNLPLQLTNLFFFLLKLIARLHEHLFLFLDFIFSKLKL
jgi:hypothetical protein